MNTNGSFLQVHKPVCSAVWSIKVKHFAQLLMNLDNPDTQLATLFSTLDSLCVNRKQQ